MSIMLAKIIDQIMRVNYVTHWNILILAINTARFFSKMASNRHLGHHIDDLYNIDVHWFELGTHNK